MVKDSERGKYTSPEGSRTWEYLSASFCALGMFCIGNMMGWNSPSQAEFMAPNSRIPMTPGDASTLTACLATGNLLGFAISVVVVDRIGRRNSIRASTVPMLVGWGMILIAESVMVLFVARVMVGITMGLLMLTLPIYQAEVLSPDIRGSMSAIGIMTTFTGVLFMFGLAPYLGVRVTAGTGMGFTMIFMIHSWFVPESPYFLAKVGRFEAAESSLVKLRGKTDVADELESIKATLREKGKSLVESDLPGELTPMRQSAVRQLFTIRGNLKAFFIGITATTLVHFCGFQSILYYCHVILRDMGSQLDIYVASLIFSVLQVLSAGLTSLTVDRFGRRPLLLGSGLITSLLLAIIAAYFFLLEHMDMDVKRYSVIPLCSIFLLVVVLNIGVVPVPLTIVAEIYAPDVKMLANCIIGITGSVEAMFTAKFYLLVVASWGLGHSVPFFGYMMIVFICTTIMMRWLPETKDKTLLEIQRELNA